MSKIILISHDPIKRQMAGPAIRYFEFAKALSKNHQVVLFAPYFEENLNLSFECKQTSFSILSKEIPKANAILSQNFSPITCFLAKRHRVKLILDAYDPEMIEYLELNKHETVFDQKNMLKGRTSSLLFSLKMADFILVASSRQKDLWLGLLSGLHKIDPELYLKDPHLKQLIDVVSFGIPSSKPSKTGPGPKEKLNLKESDKLLLWGGGIWNWFDPITLLRTMEIFSKTRPDIHLLFMGLQHPNPSIAPMKKAAEAVALAESLNLKDKTVHFNFGWTPYEERQNSLLDADIGLCLHFDNLETHFSFRTRVLDYLWASLPIISTEGDFFADLINQKQIGLTVPFENPEALAKAILSLLDDPSKINEIKKNIQKIQPRFYWDTVVEPIKKALEEPLLKSSPSAFFVVPEYIRQKGVYNIIKRIACR